MFQRFCSIVSGMVTAILSAMVFGWTIADMYVVGTMYPAHLLTLFGPAFLFALGCRFVLRAPGARTEYPPSVDDILATVRRVVAEEEAKTLVLGAENVVVVVEPPWRDNVIPFTRVLRA